MAIVLKHAHLQLKALDASLGGPRKYARRIEDLGRPHWDNEGELAGRTERRGKVIIKLPFEMQLHER